MVEPSFITLKNKEKTRNFVLKTRVFDEKARNFFEKDGLLKTRVFEKDGLLKTRVFEKDGLLKTRVFEKDGLLKTRVFEKDGLLNTYRRYKSVYFFKKLPNIFILLQL